MTGLLYFEEIGGWVPLCEKGVLANLAHYNLGYSHNIKYGNVFKWN